MMSRIRGIGTKGQPQLSASMNPQYLNASELPKAYYELQQQQKFVPETRRLFDDWMQTKDLPFWELSNPSK
jgi:hypothetical protein